MEIKDIQAIVASNRASQNGAELLTVLYEVDQIKPKVIVEIGIHQGYSMEVWKKAWPEAEVIGIDNDLHSLDFEATTNCQIIDADSHLPDTLADLKNRLNGRQIDFLFIDGDHIYDGVKQDFENYSALLRKGGIVALHDANLKDNEAVEVHKLWAELAEVTKSVLIVGELGTGTGILYL